MRALLLLSAAIVLAASAQAENFTFTGTGTQVASVGGIGPQGRPTGGGYSKIATDITWASGKKTKSTGECIASTAPPTSGLTNQLVCNSKDEDGSTSFAWIGCMSTNDKGTEGECWGKLTYTAGANKGHSSVFSFRTKQNADGKGGTSAGTGSMN